MNRRRKTELDRVGRRLFERSGLDECAVERIAESPDSYGRVLARIKNESAVNLNETFRVRRFGYPRIAVAVGVCVVAAISIFTFSVFDEGGQKAVLDKKIDLPAPLPEAARPQTPPRDIVSKILTSGRAKHSEATVEKASVKKASRRRAPNAKGEPPLSQFVSLGLSSSPHYTADGGRVIRVDLPAASLFAMGVNVPLENGSETVKADLIVGPDGVTRAVKLVE